MPESTNTEDVEVLETEPIPPTRTQAQAAAKWHGRRKLAWMIAIGADALQVALLPVFAGGLASPVADVLDVAVAVAMIALLGFHPAFLPTLVMEVIPLGNLVPTWTAAVWLVTRGQKAPTT
jgi:hypothetical protein